MADTILSRLREKGAPARLVAVLGIPLLVAVAFAGVAGWLSPGRLTSRTIIGSLHTVDGIHPGFRANHAKGMCVLGRFEGNGAGRALSRASVFAAQRSDVIGRVSLAGGQPFQPDGPDKVRSLALRIVPPDGAEWRTAMIDLPVFPAASAATFNGFTLAAAPDPATHKPDPAKIGPFLQAHPETAAALKLIMARKPTAGFADDSYHGLDSFLFTNARGTVTAVRWSFVPEQPVGQPAAHPAGDDDLFDALATALAHGPLRWHLMLTAAAPGDPTADPTRPWPADGQGDRPQVDAGTLVLTSAQSEDNGACTEVNYDPTILPPGIGTSDDPIPAARSAVYARSFRLREGHAKPPSAITPVAARGQP